MVKLGSWANRHSWASVKGVLDKFLTYVDDVVVVVVVVGTVVSLLWFEQPPPGYM